MYVSESPLYAAAVTTCELCSRHRTLRAHYFERSRDVRVRCSIVIFSTLSNVQTTWSKMIRHVGTSTHFVREATAYNHNPFKSKGSNSVSTADSVCSESIAHHGVEQTKEEGSIISTLILHIILYAHKTVCENEKIEVQVYHSEQYKQCSVLNPS